MATRYLVQSIDLNGTDEVISFNFPIPNDVKVLTGVCLFTDALVQIGTGEAQSSTDILNSFAQSVINFQKQTDETGILGTELVFSIIPYPGAMLYYRITSLSKFNLGVLNLKSYDKSQLFYSQAIQPENYMVNVTKVAYPYNAALNTIISYPFFCNRYKDKNRLFVPIKIEGNTTEISGFFTSTAFGKTATSDDAISTLNHADYLTKMGTTNFFKPCQIRMIFRYETD